MSNKTTKATDVPAPGEHSADETATLHKPMHPPPDHIPAPVIPIRSPAEDDEDAIERDHIIDSEF